MKKIIILLFIAVSLFAQFKFQRSLPDRYTVFLLGKSYNGSNTFKDYSQYNNTITTYGDTKQLSTQYKFDNGAIYFDGVNNYLQVVTGDNGDFGTGDFTVDLWVYPMGHNNGGYCGHGSSSSIGWVIDNNWTYGDNFRLACNDGSTWHLYVTDPAPIIHNQWYHIAVVRTGSIIKMYKNGIQVTSYDAGSKIVRKGTNDFSIGCMYTPGAYKEKCYIQYVRITKGKALWTANFTPPNKPY